MMNLRARSLQKLADMPFCDEEQTPARAHTMYTLLHKHNLTIRLRELRPFPAEYTLKHILLEAQHLADLGHGDIVHKAAVKIEALYKLPFMAEKLFNIAIDGGIMESCHAMQRRAGRQVTIGNNVRISPFEQHPKHYYLVKAALLGDHKAALCAAKLAVEGKLKLNERHKDGQTYPSFAGTMYARVLNANISNADKSLLRHASNELLNLCRYRYVRPELSPEIARGVFIAHNLK